MQLVSDIGNSLRHLFFPHVCKSCFAEINRHDQYICTRCMMDLPFTGFTSMIENPIEKIFFGRASIESATSLFYFTPASIVQRLIHQVKYKGQQQLGIYLGKLMGMELRSSSRFKDVDLVVPLPLFKDRERERGYNQAALLAKGISDSTGIPVDQTLVKRIRSSSTQTRKSREDRWKNVDGLFKVAPLPAPGLHILIIDDVITTGATIDACANGILAMGPVRVSIMTLAYAMK